MSAIAYAINRIRREIDPTILEKIFSPSQYTPITDRSVRQRNSLSSVDSVIRQKIVRDWVATDLELITGRRREIQINERWVTRLDNNRILIRIPPEAIDGCTIVAYYEMYSGALNSNTLGSNWTTGRGATEVQMGNAAANPIAESAMRVIRNTLPVTSSTSNANFIPVDTNTVVVEGDFNIAVGSRVLDCLISHDAEFSGMATTLYDTFAKACVLATKAYIYTHWNIPLDEGQIRSGATVGAVRSEVDKYADAQTMYNEFVFDGELKARFSMADPKNRLFMTTVLVGGLI